MDEIRNCAGKELQWFRKLLVADRQNSEENTLLKKKIYDMIIRDLNGGNDHV